MASRSPKISWSSDAFATFPVRDALARRSVELPEILLDLPEVGEELARGAFDLNEAVSLDPRRVHSNT